MHKPEQILLPLDIAGLVERDSQTILRPKPLTCSNTTWFGTSRYTYNASVSLLECQDTPTTFKKLVPIVFDGLPEWHTETPRQIKVGAVMDACQAVKNAKIKCKETGAFQKVKFRSRKRKQTLYLRADSLKKMDSMCGC